MAIPRDILCIIGPTASGKSSRAVLEARKQDGEVISVDSRQVYRGLDIGTEKITPREMQGVPHHLIDIRDPETAYSAGDFVEDAGKLIEEISSRGKLPILAGGTHFYFDALLKGLGNKTPIDPDLRKKLETLSDEELFARVSGADARRARELDPKNRRRLIRALEIIEYQGQVPERTNLIRGAYRPEWIIINPSSKEVRDRIDARLITALEHGLIKEVRRVREELGDERLSELGLEYRIIGDYLRGALSEDMLLPTLSAKLWQYARRQKAWIRKLQNELIAEAV